ncbi:MAG: DUF935 family protein [Polyangiaceae bacterium]
MGGGLTPQAVSEILRDADAGYMYRLVDLANDARQKDCHLHSVLYTRETALNGLDWMVLPAVKPGRKKPRRRDRKVAEWVEGALWGAEGGDGEERSFADLVAHLNGANYYGHAVAETLLREQGGYLVPRAFNLVSPRRFVYDQATGRLMWWDQVGAVAYPGVDFRGAHPGKFLCHQPRVNGDIACREGLVRPLMWVALFRNWDLKDWMALAELSWKPWRKGKYKNTASTEDINNLIAILEAMTASGIAVYNEDVEVDVEWPKSAAASAHERLAAFLGAEMSKAVLGQTLTTESGERGARSLGEVHDEVRKDIREGDARAIAATIRRHLIAPLVRMNFGPDVAIPDFVFLTEDTEDIVHLANGVSTLAKAGLRIPSSWVRDQAGIPEPSEDEECVGDSIEVDVSELTEPSNEEDQDEDQEDKAT